MDKRLINVRAEPSDIEAWHKAAKADNRSLSAWIRDRLSKIAAAELKRAIAKAA